MPDIVFRISVSCGVILTGYTPFSPTLLRSQFDVFIFYNCVLFVFDFTSVYVHTHVIPNGVYSIMNIVMRYMRDDTPQVIVE